ncbi:MAG: arginine repressor [Clostridia bacterium]|nr:arginine repressor [Clostridia bacterium]
MKSLRHGKILEIISKYDVETQEELTEYLKKEGFSVTQATVSRDIKSLKLIKTAAGADGNENRYKYSVNKAGEDSSSATEAKFKTILGHAIVSIDYAGNLVVLKTYAGMAQASAAAIDSMNIENILGTVAGDDTLLIVVRTENEASDFVRKIEKLTK